MALDNQGRNKLLDQLEEETLKALVKRVQQPDAPSSDLVLAWNICKDAGILAKFGKNEPEGGDLLDQLPAFPDAEEEPVLKDIG